MNLKDNQILVFGTNLKGNHISVAEELDASENVTLGKSGQTYAIPVIDSFNRNIALAIVLNYINHLIEFSKKRSNIEFLIHKSVYENYSKTKFKNIIKNQTNISFL